MSSGNFECGEQIVFDLPEEIPLENAKRIFRYYRLLSEAIRADTTEDFVVPLDLMIATRIFKSSNEINAMENIPYLLDSEEAVDILKKVDDKLAAIEKSEKQRISESITKH